jgi:hypothetical protein
MVEAVPACTVTVTCPSTGLIGLYVIRTPLENRPRPSAVPWRTIWYTAIERVARLRRPHARMKIRFFITTWIVALTRACGAVCTPIMSLSLVNRLVGFTTTVNARAAAPVARVVAVAVGSTVWITGPAVGVTVRIQVATRVPVGASGLGIGVLGDGVVGMGGAGTISMRSTATA